MADDRVRIDAIGLEFPSLDEAFLLHSRRARMRPPLPRRLSLASLAAACALLVPAASGAGRSHPWPPLPPVAKTRTFDASSRHLSEPADWTPWPSRAVGDLIVVHNLCDPDWIEALEAAAEEWTALSSAVNLTVTTDDCIRRDNADLTYVDNVIRVVHGTCGSNCCGKANVSYSYRTLQDGRDHITRYSSLIRLDGECFSNPNRPRHNRLGRQYLACHELGHAIGLGHNDDDLSCMNGYSRDNYLPGPDDIRVLDHVLYPDAAAAAASSIPSSLMARPPRPPVPPPTPPKEKAASSEITFAASPSPSPSPSRRPRDDAMSSGDAKVSSVVPSGTCGVGQCGPCQGDCDSDSHCRYGLRCYFGGGERGRRNGRANMDGSMGSGMGSGDGDLEAGATPPPYAPPPGCMGRAVPSVDYCYDPSTPIFPEDVPHP